MKLRFAITAALAVTALTGGVAAAAPASNGKSDNQSCFYTRDVNGFTAVDDSTVNIRVGVNDIYQLALFSPSPDIQFAQGIALQSQASDWICSPLDATVVVRGPMGAEQFPVNSIRKLTPTEVAALPAKATP